MKKIYTLLVTLLLLQNLLLAQSPGTLDLTFGTDGKTFIGSSSTLFANAYALAIQPDGKIVSAGDIRTNPEGGLIVRQNADGALDNMFGHGGMVKYPKPFTDLALQPDGKILATVDDYRSGILRLHSDGSFDTFMEPPPAAYNLQTSSNVLLVQSDGKIVLGTYVQSGPLTSGLGFALSRFNADGSPDVAFGTQGWVNTDFLGGYDVLSDIALQPDGKILAVGYSYDSGSTGYQFSIARYLPNGTLDNTFDSDGKALVSIAGKNAGANTVVPLSDGKILVDGEQIGNAPSKSDGVLVRLTSEGALDQAFGANGITAMVFPQNSYLRDLSILPDGKILGAGFLYNTSTALFNFQLSRYLPDGAPDVSFGSNGSKTTALTTDAYLRCSMSLQPDGKPVVAAFSSIGINSTVFHTARFHPDGLPDNTYGTDGEAKVAIVGGSDEAWVMHLQPDGKILLVGNTPEYSGSLMLARLLPSGSPDDSFGSHGVTVQAIGVLGGHYSTICLKPDGKILAGGQAWWEAQNDNIIVTQFLPDGKPDNTFGTNGLVSIDYIAKDDEIGGLALLPDGKILVAGATSGAQDILLARLLPNGTLDGTFGIGGKKVTSFLPTGKNEWAYAMTVLPDGKILVGGEANVTGLDLTLMRFLPNGSPDATFGTNGLSSISIHPTDRFGGLTMQPDGKIVVCGYTSIQGQGNEFVLARFLANGSLDASFGTGGIQSGAPGGENEIFWSVTMQPDGKIVTVGEYKTTRTAPDSKLSLARFLSNGTIDASFGNSGFVRTAFDIGTGWGRDVALQPDGKILAAGTGGVFGTDPNFAVLRYFSGLSVGLIDRPQAMAQPLIYPNPVRERHITVEYELPAASPVRIELLDLQGKSLAVLLRAERFSGKNMETLVLPEGLAEGVYLLNVQAEQGNAVVRIVVA